MKIKFNTKNININFVLFAIAFAVVGIVTIVTYASSETLNVKDSFEKSISKQDYRTHGDAIFAHINDKNLARSGNRALEIKSKSSELTRWLTPIKKYSVNPGDTVTASVYIKTSDLKGESRFTITYFRDINENDKNWSDAYVGFKNSNKKLIGSNEWTKLSLTHIAPINAQYVRPEFRLLGHGNILIDDFNITVERNNNDINNNVNEATNEATNEASNNTTSVKNNKSEEPANESQSLVQQENSITIHSNQKSQHPEGSIPYEGPNQYNWNAVPVDDFVSTSLHGINKSKGQQLFTVDCKSSHFGNNDPIVYPGQNGASHSHEFFGDTGVNAHTQTQDILNYDGNTCEVGADRSAYWTPAAFQDGKKLIADNNKFYYKVGNVDPASIQPMPVGLRMIAGNANATSPPSKQVAYIFATTSKGKHTEPKTQMSSRNLELFTTRPDENGIRIQIHFPQCWDGKYLWLPNTKHMSYAVSGKCPDSHPVPLVQIQFNIGYTNAKGGEGFKLSSGEWYTMHADFINGWHPETFERLVDVCPRAKRYCGMTKSTKTCQSYSSVINNRMGCIELRKGDTHPRFFGRNY